MSRCEVTLSWDGRVLAGEMSEGVEEMQITFEPVLRSGTELPILNDAQAFLPVAQQYRLVECKPLPNGRLRVLYRQS